MPRETTHFRTIKDSGGYPIQRQCSSCSHINLWTWKVCRYCGKRFIKRPKAKKDRSTETKLQQAEKQLASWLTNMTRTTNKIRYYSRRVAALERKLRERAAPSTNAERAIRLR